MDTQHFSQGSRFLWQGWEYEVKQILPENKVTIENQASGKAQVVALPTLLSAFYHAELLVLYNDQTGQAVPDQGALERVEIDYTPIDVMVVDQNDHPEDTLRPMYHRDRATGYIIGFSIESRES